MATGLHMTFVWINGAQRGMAWANATGGQRSRQLKEVKCGVCHLRASIPHVEKHRDKVLLSSKPDGIILSVRTYDAALGKSSG